MKNWWSWWIAAMIGGSIGFLVPTSAAPIVQPGYGTFTINGTCVIEKSWSDAYRVVHYAIAVDPTGSACR